MKKENELLSGDGEPTARMTRARAAACRLASGVLPPKPPSTKPAPKRVIRGNSKRAASDENVHPTPVPVSFEHKRRAVLKDVTNCHSSYKNCINAAKMQVKMPSLQFSCHIFIYIYISFLSDILNVMLNTST